MRAAQRDHKTGVQQPTGDLWEENVLTCCFCLCNTFSLAYLETEIKFPLFIYLSYMRKKNLCSPEMFIYCVLTKN